MIVPLLAGYAADLLLGDPRGWPHPVKGYGYLVISGTRFLNKGPYRLWKGMLLTLVLCTIVFALFTAIQHLLKQWWLPGYYIFSSVFVFFALANKSLLQEGQEVFDALEKEGLEAGRKRLSWIVGRDTGHLSAQQVRIAVLESMSENLSDGVIAPLFFYALGGLPAMMTYKMINTMDSMIGYKNEQYRLFGRFAARLDDVANFIPARLTAVLMVLLTASPGGMRFIFRYGHAHASPNSGYPEAALAGILGCRFGGPNIYQGVTVVKPYIGSREREIAHSEFVFVKYINHAVALVMVGGMVLWLLKN
ncbi:MAG: adenosylcobinamide-phosphate synthase CbiB [Sediminibacterium sp.]